MLSTELPLLLQPCLASPNLYILQQEINGQPESHAASSVLLSKICFVPAVVGARPF